MMQPSNDPTQTAYKDRSCLSALVFFLFFKHLLKVLFAIGVVILVLIVTQCSGN